MTFEEHLEATRGTDGELRVDVAESTRAAEIEIELQGDPQTREQFARKAARSEREAWRRREAQQLSKLVQQPALSPELASFLDVKIPIKNNVAVDYGEMNVERIRLRKDLRERVHRTEQRAYVVEMDHWDETLSLLDGDDTIEGALS